MRGEQAAERPRSGTRPREPPRLRSSPRHLVPPDAHSPVSARGRSARTHIKISSHPRLRHKSPIKRPMGSVASNVRCFLMHFWNVPARSLRARARAGAALSATRLEHKELAFSTAGVVHLVCRPDIHQLRPVPLDLLSRGDARTIAADIAPNLHRPQGGGGDRMRQDGAM